MLNASFAPFAESHCITDIQASQNISNPWIDAAASKNNVTVYSIINMIIEDILSVKLKETEEILHVLILSVGLSRGVKIIPMQLQLVIAYFTFWESRNMPISKSEIIKQESTINTANPQEKAEEAAQSNDNKDESNYAEVRSLESQNPSGKAPESLTRHPLQCRWALWYLKADRNKDWEDCLKQVAVFDTVEDFWALYNHIQTASGLNWGSDYYLFKEGIKPMWEDENNVKGGRWLVVVDKQKRTQLLDHYWLELLMAIIGEQFEEHGEHICGAVVNVRQKGDKVSLWTRDSLKDDVNLRIGQILKAKLEIPDSEPIRYEVHKAFHDSSVRTGSMVKPRIVIPMKETR
ncbi:Eukaryotic translation initiation factor 4E-3 [Dirofilaria immitis]|nr:Eukaryotic translation initiation factor 4E-3 [Dirofilaria immitis]